MNVSMWSIDNYVAILKNQVESTAPTLADYPDKLGKKGYN